MIGTKENTEGLSARGGTIFTFLITGVAALGALMFGFDLAIISGAGPFLQEHFRLDELQFGWGVSSLLIGCMIGSLGAGRAADRYGRKPVLISVAFTFVVSSILTAVSPNFSVFVMARIMGGLAVGAASIISPMYIAEVSPAAMRGRMVALNQLGITFGILVSYLINYLLRGVGTENWRWMFASGAAPSLLFLVLLFFVPESPRWLLFSGGEAAALKVLTRIGGAEFAARELRNMTTESSTSDAAFRLLLQPRYRRVLIVGILLAILVQISGINTVIEYAPIILRSAGNVIDIAMFQTFLIGAINFLFTFVAIFTVDRVGRRPLYIAGSMGMTVSLLLLGAGFARGHMQGLPSLVLILVFIASFAGCIGPVFWILMSEIFPTPVRGVAMSISVFVCWLANFLVVLVFPWVLKQLGSPATFSFLALMAFAMLLLAWKLVPETRGKSLEEIDQQWDPLLP